MDTTAQESSWDGKFFFMRAFLGTPSAEWKPWSRGPWCCLGQQLLRGLALKGGSGKPRVQVGSPVCMLLLVALMSPSPADTCLHGTHQEQGDRRAQVAPEVPGGLRCHARQSWENTQALFIFKALPAPTFIPAHLGGLCYCHPHLPVLEEPGTGQALPE